MFDNFFNVINVVVMPEEMNKRDDNLANSVVIFFPPNLNHLSYSIKIMYRVAITDNIKQWKVFEDDE
jgi:hypothetical protein